jgi:DNA-binding response OmpR family regulator
MLLKEDGAVLIVDGDPSICGLIAAIVMQLGRRPVVARDGRVALDLIAAQHFDAVVLDLRLPLVSGSDVLQSLASQKPSMLPRTIVVTTSPPMHAGVLEDVAAVLRKPFPVDELMEVLRECCDGTG